MKRFLLLLLFLPLLSWSQTVPPPMSAPSCYPAVNQDRADPRWFPIIRLHTDGVYWTWYCWESTKWTGYYFVKPKILGPQDDWEKLASQWIVDLQNAKEPKTFLDASVLAWQDPYWNCPDQITKNGLYGPICKTASDYLSSHFPAPRGVSP